MTTFLFLLYLITGTLKHYWNTISLPLRRNICMHINYGVPEFMSVTLSMYMQLLLEKLISSYFCLYFKVPFSVDRNRSIWDSVSQFAFVRLVLVEEKGTHHGMGWKKKCWWNCFLIWVFHYSLLLFAP